MQDTQSLKNEISASLDLLSADSLRLLAKFVSFLRSNSAQSEISEIATAIEVENPKQTIHIASPRLVHRHQVADFKKEIIEIE